MISTLNFLGHYFGLAEVRDGNKLVFSTGYHVYLNETPSFLELPIKMEGDLVFDNFDYLAAHIKVVMNDRKRLIILNSSEDQIIMYFILKRGKP